MTAELPFPPHRLEGPGLEAIVHRGVVHPDDEKRLLDSVSTTSAWRDDEVTMFGRRVAVPRRTAWHGDAGCRYSYSGLALDPAPWTPPLLELRAVAEQLAGTSFNTVLANLYRSGADSMGWHADDEPELGPLPVIASVSLGHPRRFVLRRRDDHSIRRGIDLGHGDVIVMSGSTQDLWHHAVPKSSDRTIGVRCNLTYRTIAPTIA